LRVSSNVITVLGLLLAFVTAVSADTPATPAPMLPTTVGNFWQVSSGWPMDNLDGPAGAVGVQYVEYAGKGSKAWVTIARFRQDAEAYEQLSLALAGARKTEPSAEISNTYGTAGFATHDKISFVKGVHFLALENVKGSPASLNELAQSLSAILDKGEGDIPVLVKHLPAPEEAQKNALYLNSFEDLSSLRLQQPVLDAVQSGGNADAAFATYGPSKVLLIEFNTPQLASDNDQRIVARIHELWKLGQPAPTAYRRVGNYSVLVFDAPDQQTANQLIDQVKYEQVVQWLGDNPNILKEAEKRYVNTTLGVLIAVLKASGYAAALCFGIGGLIGGLLFSYRRAQLRDVAAFSDAGGMLRLNLDELTGETNPARLLQERN
jgi:hypothetical protein